MQNICESLKELFKTTEISVMFAESVEKLMSSSGCGYISAFHFVTLKGGMNLISHNVLKRFTSSTVERRYI
jgi:hypothetical protein